ncbi:MAG: tRNA (adenosine(37)-N6)-threonylcarbamoyltransferase complex ATPase subunit type 1 TsaE [Bacteroidetes bacterium]|nr:MAG: tRNA (adenosine(37)-N6)-threonylcarbamoyltransferase complex ATPase subunit type 1 TsaE [Bacteroidota bacterium]
MTKTTLLELKWIEITEISIIAQKIIEKLEKFTRVWVWEGTLGAGKTTLIKEICKQLEVIDNVQSPSFSLINEYRTKNKEKIFHIDCYRINHEEELFDIGFEEYLFSQQLCMVEWGTKFIDILPQKYILFEIKTEKNQRILSISEINQ